MKFAFQLLTTLTAFSCTFAHPVHTGLNAPREVTIIGRDQSAKRAVNATSAGTAPELQLLADGNKVFRDQLNKDTPALLKTLTDDGQGTSAKPKPNEVLERTYTSSLG